MKLIYHLCPVDYYKSIPANQAYLPLEFDREGFIHCTRGAEQVVVVANRYYRNDDVRPLLLLVIDEERLTAEIKNEFAEDGLAYPHLYGPLNRDAILSIVRMPRLPDGSFQFPDRDQTRS
jgi:uncharacterized protein (DUF952 family)